MNVSGKLKLILTASKSSQEELARLLGVSFVTLNSWINERSLPHKKRLEKINDLYLKYTGQKKIPKSFLLGKKEILKKKSKKHKNVLIKILKNPDIYDQFILSLTYNTNSIEGSTLSENDTAAILFQDKTLANKTLTEQIEAKNHQATLKYLFRFCENKNTKQEINEELICKLHAILMNSIRDDAGFYRRHAVRIVGANIPAANFLKIPKLMKELVTDINKKKQDIISHAAQIHSQFEQIHPFSDGNGRIGRLLIHAMAFRRNLPPALIKAKNKSIYYAVLNKAQKDQDHSALEDFLLDAFLDGFEILERTQ